MFNSPCLSLFMLLLSLFGACFLSSFSLFLTNYFLFLLFFFFSFFYILFSIMISFFVCFFFGVLELGTCVGVEEDISVEKNTSGVVKEGLLKGFMFLKTKGFMIMAALCMTRFVMAMLNKSELFLDSEESELLLLALLLVSSSFFSLLSIMISFMPASSMCFLLAILLL